MEKVVIKKKAMEKKVMTKKVMEKEVIEKKAMEKEVMEKDVMENTACSFGNKDVLGEKWLNVVLRVDLKVVNKAYSIWQKSARVGKIPKACHIF